MPNYQLGKIYKIVNDVNDKIYIGSTCQTLSSRMGGHRAVGKGLVCTSAFYSAMNTIGIDHFQIVLVKSAPCTSKEELYAIEYATAMQFQRQGITLYNSIIDGRPTKETREKMGKAIRKRGCLRHINHKANNCWNFQWGVNGQRPSKSFSIKKYGFDAAHGLALFWQEEIFPIEREDDSAFIQEIKDKLKK